MNRKDNLQFYKEYFIKWFEYFVFVIYSGQLMLIKAYKIFGQVSWPSYISTDIVYKLICVLALVKIYLYFNKAPIRSLIALLLLIVSLNIHSELYYVNEVVHILYFVVLLLCSDVRKILKVYAITMGLFLTITFIFSEVGIISNTVSVDNYSTREVFLLGFNNRNSFMNYWFFVSLCLIYLFADSIISNCILLVITLYIYHLTLSKTVTIMICIFCGLLIVNSILKKYQYIKLEKLYTYLAKISILAPVYSLILTICGMVFYWKNGLDKGFVSLTLRFKNIYESLVILGIPLPLTEEISEEKVSIIKFNIFRGITDDSYIGLPYCDNIYARIFIDFGIVILLFIVFIMTVIMYRVYIIGDYRLLMILGMISLHGIMECCAVNDVTCSIMFMVALSNIWSHSSNKYMKIKDRYG